MNRLLPIDPLLTGLPCQTFLRGICKPRAARLARSVAN